MQSLPPLRVPFARIVLICAALAGLGVAGRPGVGLWHVRCMSGGDRSHGTGAAGPHHDASPDVAPTDRHPRVTTGPGLTLPDIHPLGLSGDGQPHDLRGYALPARLPFSTGT